MTDDDRYPVSADTLAATLAEHPELAPYLTVNEQVLEDAEGSFLAGPAQGDGQGARPRQNRAKRSRGAKFHNEPTFYNGRRYDSKKEARHAEWLDLLKEQGVILSWVPQVPFPLPGGSVHRVDFMVLTPGTVPTVGFQEVKGRDLAMGKLKRKQVEEIYHIHVEVI